MFGTDTSQRGSWVSIAACGLLLWAVAGCGEDDPVAPESRVASIVVAPGGDTLTAFGATTQLVATAFDSDGDPVAVTFQWTSNDTGVATVSSTGAVTAVANGDAMVTAMAGQVQGSAAIRVAQQAQSTTVTPGDATLIGLGETQQFSATGMDANNNPVTEFDWESTDPAVATVDASGLVTAVAPGVASIVAPALVSPDTATVTVYDPTTTRLPGDIVLYTDSDSWGNGEDLVLQQAPFNFVEGTDYLTRPMADMQGGIPSTTSLIVLPSVSSSTFDAQITAQNDPAAQAALDAWIRAGGWLAAHVGDNSGLAYMIPGLTGTADDVAECNGLTLTVVDHAFIRGPDAMLGTADDLTDDNIDLTDSCSDNHGSLEGILPATAEVMVEGEGGANRPVYATYVHGKGRVIVTTITLECGATDQCQPTSGHLPTLRNHYYWAINGVDAGAAPAPPAGLVASGASHPPLVTAGQGSHR